jgi:hypothetical protein
VSQQRTAIAVARPDLERTAVPTGRLGWGTSRLRSWLVYDAYVSPLCVCFLFYSDYWLIYGLFLEGGRTEYSDVGALDRT